MESSEVDNHFCKSMAFFPGIDVCSACEKDAQFVPLNPSYAKKTVLQEADELTGTGGERNDSYDHPHPNFSKVATCWSALFGITVTPRQVGLAMILMKTIRDGHKAKRDNIVDIAGYARCIERVEGWENGTDRPR